MVHRQRLFHFVFDQLVVVVMVVVVVVVVVVVFYGGLFCFYSIYFWFLIVLTFIFPIHLNGHRSCNMLVDREG